MCLVEGIIQNLLTSRVSVGEEAAAWALRQPDDSIGMVHTREEFRSDFFFSFFFSLSY